MIDFINNISIFFFYIFRKHFFWYLDLSKKPDIRISGEFSTDIWRISCRYPADLRILDMVLYAPAWGRNLTSYPSRIFHPRNNVLYNYPSQTMLKPDECFGRVSVSALLSVFPLPRPLPRPFRSEATNITPENAKKQWILWRSYEE